MLGRSGAWIDGKNLAPRARMGGHHWIGSEGSTTAAGRSRITRMNKLRN